MFTEEKFELLDRLSGVKPDYRVQTLLYILPLFSGVSCGGVIKNGEVISLVEYAESIVRAIDSCTFLSSKEAAAYKERSDASAIESSRRLLFEEAKKRGVDLFSTPYCIFFFKGSDRAPIQLSTGTRYFREEIRARVAEDESLLALLEVTR